MREGILHVNLREHYTDHNSPRYENNCPNSHLYTHVLLKILELLLIQFPLILPDKERSYVVVRWFSIVVEVGIGGEDCFHESGNEGGVVGVGFEIDAAEKDVFGGGRSFA